MMEKLIVVTPSRKVRATGGASSGLDRDASKLINEGLAHLEQEYQDSHGRRHAKPPRGPAGHGSHGSQGSHASKHSPNQGQGIHFYGASLPKSISGSRGSRRPDYGMVGASPGGAVGWLMGATPPEHPSGLYGTSPSGSILGSSFGGASSYQARHGAGSGAALMGSSPRVGSVGVGSVPLPKFQHPSHALLEDNGFKQMKYGKWYKRCLEDRATKGEPLHRTCSQSGAARHESMHAQARRHLQPSHVRRSAEQA